MRCTWSRCPRATGWSESHGPRELNDRAREMGRFRRMSASQERTQFSRTLVGKIEWRLKPGGALLVPRLYVGSPSGKSHSRVLVRYPLSRRNRDCLRSVSVFHFSRSFVGSKGQLHISTKDQSPCNSRPMSSMTCCRWLARLPSRTATFCTSRCSMLVAAIAEKAWSELAQ